MCFSVLGKTLTVYVLQLHLEMGIVLLLLIVVEHFVAENRFEFHRLSSRSATLCPNTELLIDFQPGSSKLRLRVLMKGYH